MDERCCGDCGVAPGALHVRGCDVERCPFCGRQLIGCDCARTRAGCAEGVELTDAEYAVWEADLEKAGRLPWTGEFPGSAEARAFGWYAYFHEGLCRWFRCDDPTDPRAEPDLNRLYASARWNPATKTWERP